jgi:hypothetical protein
MKRHHNGDEAALSAPAQGAVKKETNSGHVLRSEILRVHKVMNEAKKKKGRGPPGTKQFQGSVKSNSSLGSPACDPLKAGGGVMDDSGPAIGKLNDIISHGLDCAEGNPDTPRRRPNEGQQRFLRKIAQYLDQLHASKLRGTKAPTPLQLFLDGPAGTGKSFVFEIIDILAAAVDTKISPSALTGVAAGAIHTRAVSRTAAGTFTLKCFGQPVEKLSTSGLAEMAHKIDDATIIVVDEISFAEPYLIWQMHFRLQQLFGTGDKYIFGNRCVIFSGDFYQLPPCGDQSIFTHTLSILREVQKTTDDDSTNHPCAKNSAQLTSPNNAIHAFAAEQNIDLACSDEQKMKKDLGCVWPLTF